jgi:hypothetical protein
MTRFARGLASISFASSLTVAAAQELPTSLPDVREGAVVRASALSGEHIEGRFDQYRGDTLVISQAAGGVTAIPVSELARISVRGHAARRGMLVGGLVGIPVGVLAGAGLCDFERGQENNLGEDVSCAEHYVGATAVGMALGAGIGALVGRLIPKWHLRFQLRP